MPQPLFSIADMFAWQKILFVRHVSFRDHLAWSIQLQSCSSGFVGKVTIFLLCTKVAMIFFLIFSSAWGPGLFWKTANSSSLYKPLFSQTFLIINKGKSYQLIRIPLHRHMPSLKHETVQFLLWSPPPSLSFNQKIKFPRC